MPTKLGKDRSSVERRSESLDERAADLARQARHAHERERSIEAREAALQYREQELRRRESELDGDTTNPRVDEKKKPVDWNLPTIAATIEQAHAFMQQRRRSSGSGIELAPPTTAFGWFLRRVRDVCSANPLATFALGFAVGALALMVLWTIGQ